jgi:hypothetical protein
MAVVAWPAAALSLLPARLQLLLELSIPDAATLALLLLLLLK